VDNKNVHIALLINAVLILSIATHQLVNSITDFNKIGLIPHYSKVRIISDFGLVENSQITELMSSWSESRCIHKSNS
jgi:hypothetical protein